MRFRWIVALMAAPLLSPVPALAQREMYGMGGNRPQDQRRQFEAEARQQVSSFMTDYESAWGSRDVRALTALYARDGVLYPPGGGAWQGRDSIAIYFARVLPSVLPMRTRISEFRMGSDMAYVTLETVRQSALGADSLTETTGRDALVMRRDALGDWSIVWHLVRPETVVRRAIPREAPPQPAASAPTPARTGESAGATAEEARAAYEGALAAWKRARGAGDAAAVASVFADDALLVWADGVPVRGTEAVARWSAPAGMPLSALQTTVESVHASGTMAAVSGRFSVGAAPAVTSGTWTAVLVRDGGRWRIQSLVLVRAP